jgi:hypothetical protein
MFLIVETFVVRIIHVRHLNGATQRLILMSREAGMDYRELDPRDRLVVILASPERTRELPQAIDWKKVASDTLPFASGLAIPGLFLGASGIIAGYILYKALKGKRKPKLPYPLFDLRTARNQFKFPINHPIDSQTDLLLRHNPAG